MSSGRVAGGLVGAAGGPVGAWIFNEVMCKGAVKNEQGLLDLVPRQAAMGWTILMVVGIASALLLWIYNLWITRTPETRSA